MYRLTSPPKLPTTLFGILHWMATIISLPNLELHFLWKILKRLSFLAYCTLLKSSKFIGNIIRNNKIYKYRHLNHIELMIIPKERSLHNQETLRQILTFFPFQEFMSLTLVDGQERARYKARNQEDLWILFGNFFEKITLRSSIALQPNMDVDFETICSKLEENNIKCNTLIIEKLDPLIEICRRMLEDLQPKRLQMDSKNTNIFQPFYPPLNLDYVKLEIPLNVSVEAIPRMIPNLTYLRISFMHGETFKVRDFQDHFITILRVLKDDTPSSFTVFQLEYSTNEDKDLPTKRWIQDTFRGYEPGFEDGRDEILLEMNFRITRSNCSPLEGRLIYNVRPNEQTKQFLFRVNRARL